MSVAVLIATLSACAGRGQASPIPRTDRTSASGPDGSAVPPPAPSATTTIGQRPPTGFVPAAASFPSSDIGFAWGVYPCAADPNAFCAGLAVTRDAGSTWKLRSAPAGTPIDPYHRAILRFADSNDGWAALQGSIYATHDGSMTWRSVTLPGIGANPDVLAVEASGATVYVVAGAPGGAVRLFRSSVTLDDFQPVDDISFPGAGATVHLSVGDDGSGYLTADSVAGANPLLYVTDDGVRWVARASPCTNGSRTAVAAGRGGNVTVVCDINASRLGASKQLWTSTNSGSTFVGQEGPAAVGFTADAASPPLPVTVPPSSGTPPVPTVSYVVAASALEDRIYLSLNAGRSWTVAYANSSDASGSALGFADLHFSDPNHGTVILGNAGVFAKDRLAGSRAVLLPRLLSTADGGRHWAQTVIQ